MIKGKKIFITGGAGFIASAVIERLVDRNQIVCYDNFSRNSLQYKKAAHHPNIRIIEGDVLDREKLLKSLVGVDTLVHCAAITGIDTATKAPIETMKVNLIGSLNVLEGAAQLNHLDRVVIFSTSDIFGQYSWKTQEDEVSQIGRVGEPRWVYSASKLSTEHLSMAYFYEKGLPIIILRPFNVYGPGQIGESAIRNFIINALKNESLEIHGDGTQIRSWCFIDDMVEATLSAIEKPKAIGESFNIGNQRAALTIYELAKMIIKLTNSTSRIVFTRKNNVGIELRMPSINKARDLLDFEAKIELEDGLNRTIEYFRNHIY